jgi:hypothetical protein
MVKEMSSDIWCTITLLPSSFSAVTIRCDLYGKEGQQIPTSIIEKYKGELQVYISGLTKLRGVGENSRSYFAYQCGGN